MKYKTLNMFLKQTDELKRLIAEHPDYQIIVVCAGDVVSDEGGWWYAPELSFSIGELLDCEQDIDDEKTYTDRDEFEEDLMETIACDDAYENLSEEELDKVVQEKVKEYEPYWKNVIIIWAYV